MVYLIDLLMAICWVESEGALRVGQARVVKGDWQRLTPQVGNLKIDNGRAALPRPSRPQSLRDEVGLNVSLTET